MPDARPVPRVRGGTGRSLSVASELIQIASGRHFDSATVARRCADELRGSSSDGSILLAFCGGKHDPNVVCDVLRRELGPVPIVGGSAAGLITRAACSYSGFELAVAAFPPDLAPAVVVADGLHNGEREAGRELGERIAGVVTDDAVVLVFYDSVAVGAPLQLHPASLLVEGLYAGLGDRRISLIGGGLLTDMNLSDGWVFEGGTVRKHVAVALVFPPGIAVETTILHGCRPVSTFMEITRIDGAELYELDGRPALDVMEEMLGTDLGASSSQDLSLIATLGEKHGDPYAPYDENAYVNRLILRANAATRTITIFEPDFRAGTRVQIMSRDNGLMLESVRRGASMLHEAVAGRDVVLSLYVDCAGRASARSGAPVEEAEVLLENFRLDAPFLGFYSGVEIAPVNGYSRPLDWTAVLAVLYRTGGPT